VADQVAVVPREHILLVVLERLAKVTMAALVVAPAYLALVAAVQVLSVVAVAKQVVVAQAPVLQVVQ
tara:strand:+ start:414 stop:614 length:201 start_codon:yes stop_codon:yes gene_type:complete